MLDRGISDLPNFRTCSFCNWGMEFDFPQDIQVLRCENQVSTG